MKKGITLKQLNELEDFLRNSRVKIPEDVKEAHEKAIAYGFPGFQEDNEVDLRLHVFFVLTILTLLAACYIFYTNVFPLRF